MRFPSGEMTARLRRGCCLDFHAFLPVRGDLLLRRDVTPPLS